MEQQQLDWLSAKPLLVIDVALAVVQKQELRSELAWAEQDGCLFDFGGIPALWRLDDGRSMYSWSVDFKIAGSHLFVLSFRIVTGWPGTTGHSGVARACSSWQVFCCSCFAARCSKWSASPAFLARRRGR